MGPRAIEVNPMVNNESLPWGGLNGARWGVVGLTGWSEHHHKVVVMGDGSVQQGTQMSLQPTLGPCGGKGKNHKNKRAMGT